MQNKSLPYIIETEELNGQLNSDSILIVDVGGFEAYQKHHIPGSISMDVRDLRYSMNPAPGQLPSLENLERVFQSIGLTESSHVIAYDHDLGANACRLLWTLEAVNHKNCSFLNGGMTAWINAGMDIEVDSNLSVRSEYKVIINSKVIADKKYVFDAIGQEDIRILDARSPEEFLGLKSPSPRHGHIPGAVNLNWLETINVSKSYKLKEKSELENLLKQRNISKGDEIIVHCQTHQRSSHSFVMLRSLGYNNVRGYPGSWSEWSSDPEMPVE